MKITLLHYAAAPIVGGVENVMEQHARLMAEHGHEVRIVAGRGNQTDPTVGFTLVPQMDSRDPEVLKVKAELDAGRVPQDFEPLVERIRSQLAPELARADRVIAHNVCSLNKNLALTAALHRIYEEHIGARFILWHHDLAWTTPRYQAELHAGYPWDLLCSDWPEARQVVVSEARRVELATLLRVPPERINVIPNGIDLRHFLKLGDESDALRVQLQLDEAAPLLLLPVRVTPRKNIELALRVLGVLRGRFPAAKLLVTGPLGPHNPANQQYFERLLALRAELGLTGSALFLAELVDHMVPDEVIADLYRLADLLFLPSREEGFGIPILEAGLAGVPVFSSDIAPLRELGRSDVHYFAPDAEPGHVTAQIADALAASKTYALRTRTRLEYAWEQIYQKQIAPLL